MTKKQETPRPIGENGPELDEADKAALASIWDKKPTDDNGNVILDEKTRRLLEKLEQEAG